MKTAMCVLALSALSSGACADVVYNSIGVTPPPTAVTFTHEAGETSSTDEHAGGLENQSQSGQQVTLAGAARFVTLVVLRAVSAHFGAPSTAGPVTFSTTLRLYGLSNGLPSQLLYEGDSGPITLAQTGTLNYTPISFAPNLLLPDTFALELSETQVQNQSSEWLTGQSYQTNPPSVGSAVAGSIDQDTTTGVWTATPQSGFYIQVRITAVPAPSSFALISGVLPVLRRRRRSN